MLIPKHKKELVTFLRDLATGIEQGEVHYHEFRLNSTVERKVGPEYEAERDACVMAFDLHLAVRGDKDYQQLKTGYNLATDIEEQQFNAGFRNRY